MTDISTLLELKHVEWSIHNFSEKLDVFGFEFKSARFSYSNAEWFLQLGVYYNSLQSEYIRLLLYRDESASKHDVTGKIGIKKKDGTVLKAVEFKHTFSKGKSYESWISSIFFETSHLLRLKEDVAPNGTLTVFCILQSMDGPIYMAGPSPSKVESASQTHYDGSSTLIKDLKDMYLSSFQSDLTVTVKNKEFSAHKNILSSRSPVLKSMLLHDMVEKNSGSIEIPDADPDTFEDFLLFLYTGKFDYVSSRNAVSLYNAADKYDIKELKDECVRCMIDELSDDIFCDVLHLASMQNEKDLLKSATDYFINNAKTIVTTTKWHEFIEEHPLVANELFYKQLISKDNTEK